MQVYVSRLRKLLPPETLMTPAARLPARSRAGRARPALLRAPARGWAGRARRRESRGRAATALHDALGLWRGPALAEFAFEPFAQAEIGRLEELRLAAVEERIEADSRSAATQTWSESSRRWSPRIPIGERLRGQLMLALYRSGRQVEALDTYRNARRTLVDELGIEAGAALQRLEKAILRHDEELETVPIKSPRNPTNLPARTSPLVGRERELAEVLELLEVNRLVTLTGAGGSGKTSLALKAGSQLVDDFPDGVWFVSLASLTDPELLEPTIGQVLDTRSDLNDFLRGKQLLLLLDNLEQLLPDAAAIVAGFEAKVLATSRERLNLTAEQEYPVPTLALEDAAALFTRRARQLQPRFEPDGQVTELARRLDGLPLALELAAARVKVLTPAQIVERLGESLDLLSGGRDRPERQRTLRATLEWSHNLLSSGEKLLFARLGIFADSFDLATADAVATANLDVLQSLLDKSLLTSNGGGRFVMLDTLRTFARERLETAELEMLRRRQLQLLEPIAERSPAFPVGPAVSRSEQLVWLDQVEPLLPDIREVLVWALARDPARAGVLICRLGRGFLVRGGGGHEWRTWLERLLQQRSELPDEVLAEALARLGIERRNEGKFWLATVLLSESIERFRRLGDRLMAAWATNLNAFTLYSRGEYADALALSERALADFRALDNQGLVGVALNLIGATLLQLGDVEQARETLRRAIAAAESYGDSDRVLESVSSLADLELEQRSLDDAETLYLRVHDSAREIKNRFGLAYGLAGLACVAALREETEIAGERWACVERIEDESGDRIFDWDRVRYKRILEPLANDAAFRRGYEAGRAAAIAPTAFPALTTGLLP